MVFSLTGAQNDTAVIRRIFKGEPEAYRLIIEKYQPMVYAAVLAHTGNVILADKVTTATFREGFGRLVSLTDAKRLGMWLCALANQETEKLLAARPAERFAPRPRSGKPPVDLKWVQSELMDPLLEELGPFTILERKGALLHAICGLSARQLADILKLERKEAVENLARTRENVERALLKEVLEGLYPEINNKERMGTIVALVAGKEAASKALATSKLGTRKQRTVLPAVMAAAALLVVAIGAYLGYRAFFAASPPHAAPGDPSAAIPAAVPTAVAVEGEPAPDAPVVAAHRSIQGRVVDRRFPEDGVAGLTVTAGGQTSETDFYGSFEVRGLTRGEHDVTVSIDGVVLASGIRLATEGGLPGEAGSFFIDQPIAVDVYPHVPTRFRFLGRVTDRETGRPLPQFELATCKDSPDMMQPYLLRRFRAQSHPEGLLSDRFISLGDYTMYVRAPGYAPYPLRFVIDEGWQQDRVHDFPLYRATLLEGSVYGANELSITAASIIPRQGTAYGVGTGYTEYGRSDPMGRFSFPFLPVGVQSFIVHHMHHGTGRAIVELAPGETKQIRVQLPRRGTLTGDITVNGRPRRFKEFRRRISGSSIDISNNLNYISPGQYEITMTPEPVTVWGGVAPEPGHAWFERRLERHASISMDEPTWLDFNFGDGPCAIQGSISLRGSAPRAAFVELAYRIEPSGDIDRIFFNLGSSTTFRLERLPVGYGELTVYVSPRAISADDFVSARVLMDRTSRSFELTTDNPSAYIDLAL